MSLEPHCDQLRLKPLKEALQIKENTMRQSNKDKDRNVLLPVICTALDLVNKMDQQLSMEADNRVEASLLNFEDQKPIWKEAFLLILDHLFADSSTIRSACHTFFGHIRRPPSSIDFLSKELTTKLTKDGAYTNWMTNEIRKGNKDSLKTWNVLIRMMGKSIHQPGAGVQVN